MIKDMKIKIAAGLITGVLSVLGSAEAHAAGLTAVRYACDAQQSLVIQRDKATAQVRFVDRSYKLRRKPSGIGEKYISPTAALIIDGPFAVFVAEDRLQLGACTEAAPVASAG